MGFQNFGKYFSLKITHYTVCYYTPPACPLTYCLTSNPVIVRVPVCEIAVALKFGWNRCVSDFSCKSKFLKKVKIQHNITLLCQIYMQSNFPYALNETRASSLLSDNTVWFALTCKISWFNMYWLSGTRKIETTTTQC